MAVVPRILLTVGEPAGLGPDITVLALQQAWNAEIVVIGDASLVLARAAMHACPLTRVPFNINAPATTHQPGTLKIISIPVASPCTLGQLDRRNVPHVIRCLEKATDLCLAHRAAAWVTGPVHKEIINEAGIAFSGHTEFISQRCNQASALMLFVTHKLKVALATTHLALANVPLAITPERLHQALVLLNTGLKKYFRCPNPKILVCGLNPHAGEGGHIGQEEIRIITPAILHAQAQGIKAVGPLPADTLFTEKYLSQCDAILAMYHDQALPVVKALSFGQAVNVTLGLPFIRTSVDHGTGLAVAGTPNVDHRSMLAAIKLAIELNMPHP